MRRKVLFADNSDRDAERIRNALKTAEIELVVCKSMAEAEKLLEPNALWAALIILWEFPGSPSPPRGAELLLRARQLLPEVPIVIVSNALDARIATRSYLFGARHFLDKPLDLDELKSCLESLLSAQDPDLPLVGELNETIIGSSPKLLSVLRMVAQVAPHHSARVLLVGETGTGKELVAQALHERGPHPNAPLKAINIAAISRELIESQMFGHERGAFTGADKQHIGCMEEAGYGTLFLDEIGELDVALQVKLLRAIDQRKFFRVGGRDELDFHARLICASSRNLARAVRENTFSDALYHRIASVQIEVPPLRERCGDIDLLLQHFLEVYGNDRRVSFARATLRILNSYHFPGNVRELASMVQQALIICNGPVVLPDHLPLKKMGIFLGLDEVEPNHASKQTSAQLEDDSLDGFNDREQDLLQQLKQHLPANWRELPYKEVRAQYIKSIDRVYFPTILNRHDHNVTKSSEATGMDHKTFRKHWKDAGLPPLRSEDGQSDD